MIQRRWKIVVRDARGREFLGIVTYGARAPGRRAAPDQDAFRIALLSRPLAVDEAPDFTAVCVPGARHIRAVGKAQASELAESIDKLTFSPAEMRAYAAGRIVMSPPGLVEPGDIFPAHSERPLLDRLARVLVEVAEVEAVASYLAVIRHELGLAPGADALDALDARLSPEERAEHPPTRAPAIARLKAASKELRRGFAADGPLEQLVDDIAFLRLFGADAAPLSPDALTRLLDDVVDAPARRPRATPQPRVPGRVIPFPSRKDE